MKISRALLAALAGLALLALGACSEDDGTSAANGGAAGASGNGGSGGSAGSGASGGASGSGAAGGSAGAGAAGGTGGSAGAHVRQHLLLEADFEGSDPFAEFHNTQSCCDHSVTQSDEQARNGTHSFRAEVRPDDPAVSSGFRAEIVPKNVSDTGNRWYGWSMYFETPQAGGNWTGSPGGHFVQWHPDNSSGSASLSLWGDDGVWDVATNPEGDGSAEHNGSGKAITANTWHDVVFHVDWDGGIVEFWVDGEKYVDLQNVDYASGPGQYLKFGMNRWGSGPNGAPTDTWVIFYDDLRIGDDEATYADVAP